MPVSGCGVGRVNLLYRNDAAFDRFFQLEPQRFGSAQHHGARFVKSEYHRAFTLIGHLDSVLQSYSRFASARLAEYEGGCPSIQPSAAQGIQLLDAAGNGPVPKIGTMLSGDHTRKNAQTTGGDDVVMIAFSKFYGP